MVVAALVWAPLKKAAPELAPRQLEGGEQPANHTTTPHKALTRRGRALTFSFPAFDAFSRVFVRSRLSQACAQQGKQSALAQPRFLTWNQKPAKIQQDVRGVPTGGVAGSSNSGVDAGAAVGNAILGDNGQGLPEDVGVDMSGAAAASALAALYECDELRGGDQVEQECTLPNMEDDDVAAFERLDDMRDLTRGSVALWFR